MDEKMLEELILNVNNRTGIRYDILEKDYYVCLVLKELSTNQDKLQAYFKGGTAVYKILNHMNRFSEDIDLTVKVNENLSNNSNKMRLKKSALGYKVNGLELVKDDTIDKKGSITAFYKYNSLFDNNELFKSGKIQVEATSFTISEPINTYTIEPLIYKYANVEEKKILKEEYDISGFEIEIIKLERIFVDKIFAAEFYNVRKMYDDVAKHLYDIAILMSASEIKLLLDDKVELRKLINYKRKEELARIGGVNSDKQIIDFSYLTNGLNSNLIEAIYKMQNIYVLDDNSKLSIKYIEDMLKELRDKLSNIS